MVDITYGGNADLEVLHQFFASATHDASAAMCRWTDSLITLTLDEVRVIPLEDVCTELAIDDEPLTMVVLSLEGEVGGEMILAFDEENSQRLVAALLRADPGPRKAWSDLQKSALTETGNILGCAYMNALTRLIDRDMVPTPPYLIEDYGASVLQQALMAQAATCDDVLICRTGFHREGEELNWVVVFVPTDVLRKNMEAALHSKRIRSEIR